MTRNPDGTAAVVLEGHADRVTSVAWLGDDRLATGSFDKTVKLWNVAGAEADGTLTGHQDHVLTVATYPPESLLASGGKDRVVKLWNLASSNPPKDVASHAKSVLCVVFSPDGRFVASCGEDDTRILLWDVTAGKSFKQLNAEDPDDKNQRRSIHSLAFSPDGRQLASCGADRTVRLWDVEQGQEIRRLEAAEYLLFTEKDNKVERTAKKAASEMSLYAVAFSPDGKRIAAGGLDKTIRIWAAASGELRQTIAGHDGFVYSLAFDGAGRVVSGGHTGRIGIWNVDGGKLVSSHRVPDFTQAIAVSPSGSKVAAACTNARAYVIPLDPENAK